MTGPKPTTSAKRSIVLLVRPEILETARMELADTAILLVKAVTTVKEALTSIPAARPHCLVFQNNMAMPQHILAAKQLADLSASRKVPVVIFGGPLDPALDEKKANLGITDVVDGEYKLAPVLEAIKTAIARVDKPLLEAKAAQEAKVKAAQQKREADLRRQQIQERLMRASQKLQALPPDYGAEPPEPPPPPKKQFDAQALPQDDIDIQPVD
ncbi:MAG: hypothetical protein KF754_07960 [Planctomycetes bacterium]|nr:hypothetical protein [Planctomycetota bacterium]